MPEQATNPEQHQFDIQSALLNMGSETARLQAEVDENNLAGSNTYPDWWSSDNLVNIIEVQNYLRSEGSSPDEVAAYYKNRKARDEIRSQISGYESLNLMESLSGEWGLGPDAVANGLRSETEDGQQMRADMISLLSDSKACLNTALDTMVAYYGVSKRTELLGIKGSDEFDTDVNQLLLTENAIKWIRFQDAHWDTGMDYKDYVQIGKEWMALATSLYAGIPESEAKEYTFTAGIKGDEESFLGVIEKFKHFGAERIRKISEFTNIHGLEGYSVGQLERMERLIDSPEAAAAELEGHDVNLVLINRSGDHNGVLKKTAADIEDGETSERNLFFEIDRLSDIYKTFVKLKKAGIKPSTLLMAAHSAPGQFMVSDDRDPAVKRRDIAVIASSAVITLANEQGLVADGDTGFSIQDTKGFRRLVDQFMQPSRGIDDNKQHLGRKKIIFQSCHMGSKIDAADVIDGEKQSVGKESVVSKLAKSLVGNGLATLVDIYGAPGGIQMHATEEGLGYSGEVTDFNAGRSALKAVRVRATPESIVQGRVKEVKLR